MSTGPKQELPYTRSRLHDLYVWLRAFALRTFDRPPTLRAAWLPLVVLSFVLFCRLPTTNYIFDEQEALLANPYVNATDGLAYRDAIHRDFWGLKPDRSVGSYRPLPNFVWRAPWEVASRVDVVLTPWRLRLKTWLEAKGWMPEGATLELGEAVKRPFVQHLTNLVLHGLNGALLAALSWVLTRRRLESWLIGVTFVTCAVLTEAVSGIVGIADVMGGLGALMALHALRLPGPAMPLAVAFGITFGLFSKESALVCVPLIPLAAFLFAPMLHPERPRRALRALIALAATTLAFILYVELRKIWFPSPLPEELQNAALGGDLAQLKHTFLVWFHQAPLPKDPLNNPLAAAEPLPRIAGAMRVYARGLGQVLFPWTLSGDYSYPQEPAPERIAFPESVVGAALTVLPPIASVVLWIAAYVRERRILRGRPRPPRDPNTWWLLGASTLMLAASIAGFSWTINRGRAGLPPMEIDGAWLIVVPFAMIDLARSVAGRLERPPYAMLAAAIAFGLDVLVLGEATDGIPFTILMAACAVAALSGVAEALGDPKAGVAPVGAAPLAMIALGATWVVVSYFPHSNVPVVLPTVRAERFWYFPAMGTSLILGLGLAKLTRWRPRWAPLAGVALAGAFLAFQSGRAYAHSMDYRDDLVFWRATKNAVPNSAKAHLNYSIMIGARGDLQTRLVESQEAIRLAPKWAMAHVYTGDVLCRMHRVDEAWPHYEEGFKLGPNDPSLIALALQCLWDEKRLKDFETPLRKIVDAEPGSWIAYLGNDTLANGEAHHGVDPQYRPRGYNEKAKDDEGDKTATAEGSGSAGASASAEGAAEADDSAGDEDSAGADHSAGSADDSATRTAAPSASVARTVDEDGRPIVSGRAVDVTARPSALPSGP